MAAVSGAGEILHDGFDAELLRTLLKLSQEGRGEYGERTTHLQKRCQVGHQAVAPMAAGNAAGVTAAERWAIPCRCCPWNTLNP